MDDNFPQISEILNVLIVDPIWSAIFFLMLSFIIVVWTLSRRQLALMNKFITIEEKIDQLSQSISSTKSEMVSVKNAVGGVEDTLTDVNRVAEDTKRDVANLSDGISGETQVSSAIELAREGASIEKIVAATGISRDEAEAVVKFHRPNN